MLLPAGMIVYVVSKEDGTYSKSSLNGWFNSLVGGSKWEDYEVTTDEAYAKRLQVKYKTIAEVVQLMQNMTPDQTGKVVELLRGHEDLMELHDEYA
jgi:hypothetical protein